MREPGVWAARHWRILKEKCLEIWAGGREAVRFEELWFRR